MRILLSAYACEPNRGSEPGVGWNWAREIARHHDVWVITRANNRRVIEAELSRIPPRPIHFIYVDLPSWARFWKRGPRGARLYYYLWQFAALKRARTLHNDFHFDFAHHVTFATAYVGALICLLPIPFVWGPVGGCSRVPWRLARIGGTRGLAYEALRACRRGLGRFADPFVRLTWRRARMILVQNPETLGWLPRRHRSKALVWPGAGFEPEATVAPTVDDPSSELTVVIAGRLIHLKGVALALRAAASMPRAPLHLVIAGDGPERQRLQRLASRLGIEAQVEFRGWVRFDELLRLFAAADVLMFPSLHDEAPLVVIEAMAYGAVPVVLDVGGPPVLVGDAGIIVKPSNIEATTAELAEALVRLSEPSTRARFRARALKRAAEFRWERRIRVLPFIPPEDPL
jgi:glycosyltransferase involved in cell wall biosynthesis